MINTFLLHSGPAVILLAHSIFSVFSGDVNHFGTDYLDHIGFAPFGLYLAWIVKLSHLFSVPLLLMNRWIKPVSISNIILFVLGIILIHAREGWSVVGGGRNGVEFNFLLIICFLSFLFPEGFKGLWKK